MQFPDRTVDLAVQPNLLILFIQHVIEKELDVLVLAHLIFFGIVGLLAMATSHWKKDIEAFYFNRVVYRNHLNRQQYLAISNLLSTHTNYFRMLSSDGKARFINRLIHFSERREFIGMKGLKVTREMQILISASAVQLTFGLRDYQIRFLETIRIFPEPFYHPVLKSSLKGAMSTSGFLAISWKDFLQGYAVEDDNYNLGLHEMAHALKLDVKNSDRFDLRFSTYVDRWLEVGLPAFQDTRKNGGTFLRKYGGTNRHEFFAVCVEHFFESPERFSRELPDVYNHLCKLLNQNPINSSGDYRVTDSFKRSINKNSRLVPVPEKFQKRYPTDGFHWFHQFTMATIFISLIIDLVWGFNTVVNWIQLSVAGGVAAVLAGFLQHKYLINHRVLNGFFAFFYGVAVVVFVCNLYVFMNWIFPVADHTSYHEIQNVEQVEQGLELELKDGAFAGFSKIRTVPDTGKNLPSAGKIAAFRFEIGCVGMPVLKKIDFGHREGNKFIPTSE